MFRPRSQTPTLRTVSRRAKDWMPARWRPSLERLEDRTLLTTSTVGVGPGVHLTNLALDTPGDENYYRFEVLRPDSLDVRVRFTVNPPNLTVEVTDKNLAVIGTSTTVGDTKLVSLSG